MDVGVGTPAYGHPRRLVQHILSTALDVVDVGGGRV